VILKDQIQILLTYFVRSCIQFLQNLFFPKPIQGQSKNLAILVWLQAQ